jgi:hypothetical protein
VIAQILKVAAVGSCALSSAIMKSCWLPYIQVLGSHHVEAEKSLFIL